MTESYGLFDYPDHPGAKARDTSFAAAEKAAPTSQILRGQCLALVREYGPLTADEAATLLGKDRLAIRPRFSELAVMGSVTDSGVRRENISGRSAIVWAAA